MPEEKKESQFKELVLGLSEQQQAEFFKTLHEAGISPKDTELAKLLHALQLYKAYYETIPEAIQKVAAEIERIKKEAEVCGRDAHQSSETSAQLTGRLLEESERIRKDLRQVHEQMEKGVGQWSTSLSTQTSQLLNVEMAKILVAPLKELTGANEAFGKALAQSRQAVNILRDNVNVIRRVHLWTYGLGGIVVLCSLLLSSWIFIHHRYQEQLEEERAVYVGQIDKNRAVLTELARFHRTLDLIKDSNNPKRKLVVMKDASGWQAPGKLGVIEFSGGD